MVARFFCVDNGCFEACAAMGGSRVAAGPEAAAGKQQRILGWEGCLNSRDLGGYATRDGRETRWGQVVRSDRLGDLTEAGQSALLAHGIRTIIDLRRPAELRLYPNPFADPAHLGGHGITYVNISLVDPGTGSRGDFATLADDYIDMLETFAPSIARIMATIAGAPAGGIVIHCMAGKDRTGIVSALLLDLAGVHRETIGADYALTAECLRPAEEEWLVNGPGTRKEREAILTKYAPTAAVILAALAHLDDRHGGSEPYLRARGVSDDQIGQLRARLLDR
jgi:protein-tyrosine phosphatase